MAAADSVAHWLEYMQPLAAKGYKLGMAATTSAPSGLQWVKDFIGEWRTIESTFYRVLPFFFFFP